MRTRPMDEPMTARAGGKPKLRAYQGAPGSDRLSSGGFRADELTGARSLQ
jgi:hypothetical protein